MVKIITSVWLTIALVSSFPAPGLARNYPPKDDGATSKVELLLIIRQPVIEELVGTKFPAGWRPTVVWGFRSDETNPNGQKPRASYSPELDQFRFDPKLKIWLRLITAEGSHIVVPKRAPDWVGNLEHIIDHELTHALINHLSHELGLKCWPNYKDQSNQAMNELDVINEGIACYYEHYGNGKVLEYSLDLLPKSSRYKAWAGGVRPSLYYVGGEFIVTPIIDRFGLAGVKYLIIHPLKCQNGNIYRAVPPYQAQAVSDLAPLKPTTP